MHPRAPLALTALIFAGAIALAGCGDDARASGSGGDATGSSTNATAASGSSTTATSGAGGTGGDGAGGAGLGGAGLGGDGAGGAGLGGAGQGGDGAGGAGLGGAGQGGAGGAGGTGGDGAGGDGGTGGSGGGPPIDGYGELSGSCGDLDAPDLLDSAPEILAGTLDLSGEAPITLEDPAGLTPGAQEMISDGNLGGSSLWSEVFAFEVLARCEGASLIKSEGEIQYDIEGKKTDILVEIDGLKVGVSVVRAVGFPPEDPYTVEDAFDVLEGKLDDILQSSVNVAPEDAWVKQILSVVAYSQAHADSMLAAWDLLDDETRADTIVFITVTDGDDDFIYFGD